MEGRKAARVILKPDFTDPSDKASWPAMYDWLVDTHQRLRTAIAAAGGFSEVAASPA
jgi:hypothetical protein